MTRLDSMTSDTAKPETNPQARPETFRSHLPAIVAATTGTVLAAILGSLIGAAGTIAGIVIGSLASGTASWWAERGIRRSAALAAARAEAIRARATRSPALHPGEHAAVTQAAAITRDTAPAGSGHDRPRPRWRWRWRWAGPAAFIIAAFIGGALVVTLIEGAAGKPLSAVVQGKPGHGPTLFGGTVGKAAPPARHLARHPRHRPARQGPAPPAPRPAAPRRPAPHPPPRPAAPARSAARLTPQPPLPRRLARAASRGRYCGHSGDRRGSGGGYSSRIRAARPSRLTRRLAKALSRQH